MSELVLPCVTAKLKNDPSLNKIEPPWLLKELL